MAGFTTSSVDHIIRSNLWSTQLKDVLLDDLMGMKYVRILSDFPDGETFNVPSIGAMEAVDYSENNPIQYSAMDTGNYTFSITDYKSSATYVTNKMKQDSMWMSEIESTFVPKQHRALMEAVEQKVLSVGPDNQTASDLNTINGGDHRFVGGGASDAIAITDFAKAKYALQKANVPMTNLVAIVDPSVEYILSTQTNLVNLSNNPRWEGVVKTGIATGMKFITTIFGFDVYVSNYLKDGISETIDSNSVTNGVANLFFSASSDVLPLIGAIRQPPKVDSEYNKDLQRDEYVTTMRYGFDLFRPENLVTVITDKTVV